MSTGSKRRRGRAVDGIVLLDKPTGMSSNQALQQLKQLYRAAKAGHTGSLDPLATGLLPVCLGEATKLAGLMLTGRKGYLARARLGVSTDTDDADGRVLQVRPVPDLDEARIGAALGPLTGRIRQRAPVYSALKRGGEALYAKARRGEAVEAPVREIHVVRIQLQGRGPDWLELAIDCGAGTYVRSLVRDLGEALGCGAHVTALQRTWAEPFPDPVMWTLEQLQQLAADRGETGLEAALLPLEAGLAALPRVDLDAAQEALLRHGQAVPVVHAEDGPAWAAGSDGRAIALVDLAAGELRPRRLLLRGAAPVQLEPR
ncbi:MAG TPA: tRNA pseudouridine(55) synthase TruB [Xanthomonadaceae bacterium]|nr:tRNA pseudouridine(55) synthase TruB [Xanthomonadaceae bacterium]